MKRLEYYIYTHTVLKRITTKKHTKHTNSGGGWVVAVRVLILCVCFYVIVFVVRRGVSNTIIYGV